MKNDYKPVNATGIIAWLFLLINAIIMKAAYLHDPKWHRGLLVTAPLFIIAIIFSKQKEKVKQKQNEKQKQKEKEAILSVLTSSERQYQ